MRSVLVVETQAAITTLLYHALRMFLPCLPYSTNLPTLPYLPSYLSINTLSTYLYIDILPTYLQIPYIAYPTYLSIDTLPYPILPFSIYLPTFGNIKQNNIIIVALKIYIKRKSKRDTKAAIATVIYPSMRIFLPCPILLHQSTYSILPPYLPIYIYPTYLPYLPYPTLLTYRYPTLPVTSQIFKQI